MLTKPEAKSHRALHALSGRAEWTVVDEMFQAELAETFERMMTARDVQEIHRLQGRAQFIRDLRTLVREAPKTLEKLRGSSL